MNYVPALSTCCCSSCGDEHPIESMLELRFKLVCVVCFRDQEVETMKADAAEFRALSVEWFKSGELVERQPFMLRNQFGGIWKCSRIKMTLR